VLPHIPSNALTRFRDIVGWIHFWIPVNQPE